MVLVWLRHHSFAVLVVPSKRRMVVAMTQGGISSLFYIHGKLCSYHPVEVLLVCITGAVCLLTLNIYDATHHFASQQNEAEKVRRDCVNHK